MVHICKINVIFDLSCSGFIMTVNYRTISDQEREICETHDLAHLNITKLF